MEEINGESKEESKKDPHISNSMNATKEESPTSTEEIICEADKDRTRAKT